MFSNNHSEQIPRVYPPPDNFHGEDIIGDELYGRQQSIRSKQPPNLGQYRADYEEHQETQTQPIYIEKQVSVSPPITQSSQSSIVSDVIVKNIKLNLEINLKINVI